MLQITYGNSVSGVGPSMVIVQVCEIQLVGAVVTPAPHRDYIGQRASP